MSDFVEALKSKFSVERAKLHRIEVPGIGIPIFVKPLTQEERMKIYEKGVNGLELQIRSILLRALDEHGTPMLGLKYRTEFLKHVSPRDIDYISDEMAKIEMDMEDAEKKSETT